MSAQDTPFEQQESLEENRTERQMAMEGVAAADQMGSRRPESIMAYVGDADIGSPPDAQDGSIEDLLSVELSHQLALGNITPEEWERRTLLDVPVAMQVKAEFPQRAGASSKCTGRYRRELLGKDADSDKPPLTPEMARKIDGVLGEEGVRSQQRSLSINATAFKGITESRAVARLMGRDDESGGDGGIMQTAKSMIGFGGD